MSIATTVPQRSQRMSLLSITSLVSGGRRGRSTDPASSRVLPITASIWRVNSSPKGLKIAARCVVIGSSNFSKHSRTRNFGLRQGRLEMRQESAYHFQAASLSRKSASRRRHTCPIKRLFEPGSGQ
jgi:hypothetical protein